MVWVLLAGAVATYLTRIGGHLILSQFDRVHPRVEACLNAVPAAVLTSIVAPAAYMGGAVELAALAATALASLRGGLMTMFVAGAAVLIAGRALF